MMARRAEAAQVPRLIRPALVQRHDVIHFSRALTAEPAHVQVAVQDTPARPLPVPPRATAPLIPALLVATLTRLAA